MSVSVEDLRSNCVNYASRACSYVKNNPKKCLIVTTALAALAITAYVSYANQRKEICRHARNLVWNAQGNYYPLRAEDTAFLENLRGSRPYTCGDSFCDFLQKTWTECTGNTDVICDPGPRSCPLFVQACGSVVSFKRHLLWNCGALMVHCFAYCTIKTQ